MIGEPVVSGISLEEGLLRDGNWSIAAQYVMSPPIREARHRLSLKKVGALHVCLCMCVVYVMWTSLYLHVASYIFVYL